MRTRLWIVAVIAMAGGAVYWAGCGDDEKQTTFAGNVSSVSGASAALRRPERSTFAFHLPQIPAQAFAQGTCAVPGSADLLFCVKTSNFEVCEPVNQGDCKFTLITGLEQDRLPAVLRFVDDTNQSGAPDSGEGSSTVTQSLLYCNGDVVSIANAAVNFTTGVTTATVTKTVDRCTNAVATQTPRPAGTGTPTRTPTRTGTPATPTPTGTGGPYASAAPLNQPPTNMLAFLFSAGAVGLIVPRRRRRAPR